jgi:hypothetical protein
MDARFKFKIAGAEGECTVRYEFADYGASEDQKAEFSHEVDVSTLAEKFRQVSKSSIKKPLQELVARFVAEKFKNCRERKVLAPPMTARKRTRGPVADGLPQTGNLFDGNL